MKNTLISSLGLLSCVIMLKTAESIIPPFMQYTQREEAVVHRFRPTADRCCRVGQRAARKMMSCSIRNSQRLFNSVHTARSSNGGIILRNTDSFFSKVTVCATNFSTSFEKCCVNKENFLKEIRICRRRYRERDFRAKCIKIAKSKYGQ
ncbi:uncharacterized protein LOC125668219 [Ostrea edulis]|uniref:uncharacterized protein LOC125668219 n=1 Tax=Ostrea edulis TaxID=37623 RepID=UPI0020959628|nr:uncharacterized protein LOC125668219 [Ostrea edulis]